MASSSDFAPGDKVMQVENDYDKEIYNGDIGYIDDVAPEAAELTASFDGRAVTYSFGDCHNTSTLLCPPPPNQEEGFICRTPASGLCPPFAKKS
jgi:hypothetical protein